METTKIYLKSNEKDHYTASIRDLVQKSIAGRAHDVPHTI